MPLVRQAKSLPEFLREQGILSPEQLQTAQAQAAALGVSLKQVIVQQGLITEPALTTLLAEQYGMATIDLTNS